MTVTAASAAYGVGNRGPLRQQGVRKTAPFKRMIAPKCCMKAILALAVFANDDSCLVVSDLDDVRFGHDSSVAGTYADIL